MSEQTPHDVVAYPSFSFPETHPSRMAAMATLHGLSPAPVDACRVLEIGCNEGGNLIPMAYSLPGSQFVGFDLAGATVERGKERVRALGLENIRLFEADLLKVGRELGEFDYIVAHGVYAWVPLVVSDRILPLCGELLAPNGVAFISYDALPGGYQRTMLREMMLFGAEGLADPGDRVAAGREFLQFLHAERPEGDPYRTLIQKQLDRMDKRSLESIFHDELTDSYHPVYFSDFAARAGKHGLQYLSEAALASPKDPTYRSALWPMLEAASGGDIVKQEQILDFVRMRNYRETLLCRAECAVRRDYPIEQIRRLRLASPATSGPGETPGATEFTLPDGIKTETNHPHVVKLLKTLEAAWPHRLSFAQIEESLGEPGFPLNQEGAVLLMRLAVSKMIEFYAWTPGLAEEISLRPRASASARLEASIHPWAVTLLHSTIGLHDKLVCSFLKRLDGNTDREAVTRAVGEEFPDLSAEELEAAMKQALGYFYRVGMLEA